MYGRATKFYTFRMCPEKWVKGFTLISVGFERSPLICSLIMALGGSFRLVNLNIILNLVHNQRVTNWKCYLSAAHNLTICKKNSAECINSTNKNYHIPFEITTTLLNGHEKQKPNK